MSTRCASSAAPAPGSLAWRTIVQSVAIRLSRKGSSCTIDPCPERNEGASYRLRPTVQEKFTSTYSHETCQRSLSRNYGPRKRGGREGVGQEPLRRGDGPEQPI